MYMYIHECMASKNMAIREDVYHRLSESKMEGESFSDVIERLLERRETLLPLWGALANSSEVETIEREIKLIREKAVIRKR